MSAKAGYRPKEAAAFLGSREVLERMRVAGWVKPVLHNRGLTIYSYAGLMKAFKRLEDGEQLPFRPASASKTK